MNVDSSEPAPTYSQRELWVILGSLMLATVLSAVDTSIVSTALPTIAGKLGGFESYAWVGTAYILSSTISTPILGKLGDLLGRRRMILATILIFTIGSLLCGISRSMPQLIGARAVQGVGGGGIQALTFAILGDLVSPRERGRYMGLYTGIFAGSAVAGPLLGGWMITHFDWPWIFLVNLPIAAIAFAAIFRTLTIKHVKRAAHIDLIGAVLLSAFLGCLVIALQEGRNGWNSTAFVLVGAAVSSFAVFLWWELRTTEPLVPLHLFGQRIFATGAGMGTVAGSMAFGVTAFLPLQFQDANFVSPTSAGLYTIPLMCGIMFGSAYGGKFIAKTGRYKVVPITALAMSFAGTIALSQLTRTTPYWMLILPMFGIGAGNGATFTTSSIATQNAIDPALLGIGTATLVSLRSLGGSISLAGYGALFTSTVNRSMRTRLPVGALPRGKPVSSLIREPKTIRALPREVRDTVVAAITGGTARVFLFAIPLVAVGLALALSLPELPLRTTAGGGGTTPTEI